jgi:uncharacterized protein YabN with tetrapyrrole methylase and pyrophosphatase domain
MTERRGSVTIVGTGYFIAARITAEAATHIRHARKLFYLVYDWMDETWLRQLNPKAISLMSCCKEGRSAQACCQEMVDTVMRAVRRGQNVCMAFSGHPSICIDPTRKVYDMARQEGFRCVMLPGLSALDCFFADVGINPMKEGCRIFDTTRFLIRKHRVDRSSGLLLLQVSNLGKKTHQITDAPEEGRLKLLEDALVRVYGARHRVIHYQAATSPLAEPIIERLPVSSIHKCDFKFKSTIYIPPLASASRERRPGHPDS